MTEEKIPGWTAEELAFEAESLLQVQRIVTAAGWVFNQDDQNHFYFTHSRTGRIIEIYSEYDWLDQRSDEKNHLFEVASACGAFIDHISEITTKNSASKLSEKKSKDLLW